MNVLLAVSDRFFGDALVKFARHHHWEENAHFKLIKAVLPAEHQPGSTNEDREISFQEEIKLADSLLKKLCAMLGKNKEGCDISSEVLIGSPAKVIIEYANNWPADMIILGAHEQSNFEKIILGSVSKFISENAPCSFTIVRIANDEALDLSLDEDEVLEELGIPLASS